MSAMLSQMNLSHAAWSPEFPLEAISPINSIAGTTQGPYLFRAAQYAHLLADISPANER